MVPNRKITLVDLPKLQEQLLGAARQYSRGSTGSLAELRRTAIAFAAAERPYEVEQQCRNLASLLIGFGGLSKAVANKIASEIKSTGYLIGPFISFEGFDGEITCVGIERHYWKFDGAGKLVERGVKD